MQVTTRKLVILKNENMDKNLTNYEKELLEIELRNKPPAYMNSEEAAIYLNFSLSMFHQEIKPYLISVVFGTRKNYRKQDLDKFMESLLVSPERIVEFKKR